MYVILSHCSSVVSCTYMYLLDSSGNLIEYSSGNNGKGECGSSLDLALIEKNLEAGTYYVVSEGYEESGPITTNIIAYAPGDFNYPVVPGVYNEEDGSMNINPNSLEVRKNCFVEPNFGQHDAE